MMALVVFATLSGRYGLVALAWGIAVNAAFALTVTGARLLTLGGLGRGRAPLAAGRRLWWLVRGTALPIALQVIYVIALRLAAALGVGTQTTLSYGYVIAATLVAATASALALVSSVPLTRREPDAAAVAEHVVHTVWLSLTPILAAAGVFALVGGDIVGGMLGSAYTGDVGRELGRLVVWLAPWMVATVAFTVAYPMLFVVGRGRGLVPLAVGALVVQVPLAWGLREVWGLNGIALQDTDAPRLGPGDIELAGADQGDVRPGPISRPARAGNIEWMSSVAVKSTLMRSSWSTPLRSIIASSRATVRSRTCSAVSASTVVAPRRARTAEHGGDATSGRGDASRGPTLGPAGPGPGGRSTGGRPLEGPHLVGGELAPAPRLQLAVGERADAGAHQPLHRDGPTASHMRRT